jgi:ABC-2 type transport system ATP-binding protein
MYGMGGAQLRQRITDVLEIVELSDRSKEKIETYSGGMKRRINIAVGLLHQPKVLYMDEPTVGIDPQSRRRILDTVIELNKQGLTVLYTTHYMEEAAELSDRIGIVDHGKLIALGTQAELTKTVGEYDTLRVGIDSDHADPESLVAAVSSAPGVHRASMEDGSLIVQAEDANAVLGQVVSRLEKAGARMHSLRVDEPNLEAVFLHLTGRALRD